MKKTTNWITRFVVIAAMALIICSGFSKFDGSRVYAGSMDENQLKKYSYSVRPAIAPFNNVIYVTTNNPDPTSFRLVDKVTKYTAGTSEAYRLLEKTYIDVKYEDKSKYRVKGGYIFYNPECDSDGGELTLQYNSGDNKWTDTSINISCAVMEDDIDYIIDTYTNEKTSFFDKMDAAQTGLNQLSVYPNYVADNTKPTDRPYPFLAASPHKDLTLNEHYDIYQRSDEQLFLKALYPYVLDSLSFPGTISAIAKRLDSNATAEWNSYYHYIVGISLNGETGHYGGAGRGDNNPPYITQIDHAFTFDGGSNDYSTIADLSVLSDKYYGYSEIGNKNVENLRDLITGETFCKTIAPGTWVRVAREGMLGYGTTFAYVAYGPGGSYKIASDAWVDGRYINEYEVPELGATFDEHNTADIILRNVSYTDKNGKSHENDIVYSYDKNTDTWRAPYYYSDAWWFSSNMELPTQFILTQEQVKNLKVDANSKSIPESGKIYDGKSVPGTPFTNKLVKGLTITKELKLETGTRRKITATINPSDATDNGIYWGSSNPDIASVNDDGEVFANKEGEVIITARTIDGGFTAECKVTVIKATTVKSSTTADQKVDSSTAGGANKNTNTRSNSKSKKSAGIGKGASAAAAEKAITGAKNDNDPVGSEFGKLQLKSGKQTKNAISLNWKKVKGAKKYVVYGNACGKKNKMKKLKTLSKNNFKVRKIAKKKLKKGTYHKFIVVALDKNNKVVSTSKVIHVATKGGKVGNNKAVTTKAKKNKVTLKKGRSFKLEGKAVAASKKLKVKKHRAVAYETSNAKVATVSKKGVIKGGKKGKCKVYVYTQDGQCKVITVTVK